MKTGIPRKNKKRCSDIGLNEVMGKRELGKMLLNHSVYESRVKNLRESNEVSWGDINIIGMETDNIISYIKDGDYVLDAGCSNGFSTFKIAGARDIKVRAFDYSRGAIDIALKEQISNGTRGKIAFYHGNILNIAEPDNSFDVAYTIRVLINLPSWKFQKAAILELHRVLKPKGLYLLSEAFSGSLKKINAIRAIAQMKPLTTPKFNLYLEERQLEWFLKKYFHLVEIKKFSSIYYVASRFLRYLTMKKGQQDTYVNPINNFFAKYPETENSGDFGIQKLYVLRKK